MEDYFGHKKEWPIAMYDMTESQKHRAEWKTSPWLHLYEELKEAKCICGEKKIRQVLPLGQEWGGDL